jgi:hypothetical protein
MAVSWYHAVCLVVLGVVGGYSNGCVAGQASQQTLWCQQQALLA